VKSQVRIVNEKAKSWITFMRDFFKIKLKNCENTKVFPDVKYKGLS
jgi:hypothetical protein